MSPRRKVEAGEPDYFDVTPRPPRRWGLAVVATAASLVIAAALTLATLILVSHDRHEDSAVRDADVLGYVSAFMAGYTTLDPFNANAYVDRVLAQATGDFAKNYKEKENEILIQVARGEPTKGQVADAGVQRWRDDGSVDVLVATKVSRKSPDGKSTMESGDRWVVTAIKEGQQWKISQLIPVI